jgi:hypothetical protein
MGCDIHFFIERRDDKDHKWYLDPNHDRDDDEELEDGTVRRGHINSVGATGRDYGMFGVMAGVRGGGELFEARGIPDDVSELGDEAMNQYGVDGHSHSWLTLEEFKMCLDEMEYDTVNDTNGKAFFNYGDYKWDDPNRPTDYVAVYHYAVNWIAEQKKAQADITPHLHLEPEVRFIFFFDN